VGGWVVERPDTQKAHLFLQEVSFIVRKGSMHSKLSEFRVHGSKMSECDV